MTFVTEKSCYLRTPSYERIPLNKGTVVDVQQEQNINVAHSSLSTRVEKIDNITFHQPAQSLAENSEAPQRDKLGCFQRLCNLVRAFFAALSRFFCCICLRRSSSKAVNPLHTPSLVEQPQPTMPAPAPGPGDKGSAVLEEREIVRLDPPRSAKEIAIEKMISGWSEKDSSIKEKVREHLQKQCADFIADYANNPLVNECLSKMASTFLPRSTPAQHPLKSHFLIL